MACVTPYSSQQFHIFDGHASDDKPALRLSSQGAQYTLPESTTLAIQLAERQLGEQSYDSHIFLQYQSNHQEVNEYLVL